VVGRQRSPTDFMVGRTLLRRQRSGNSALPILAERQLPTYRDLAERQLPPYRDLAERQLPPYRDFGLI